MVDYSKPNFYIHDAQPERSEFYEWVGRCLKRWADIEGYMFEISDWALNGERSISAIVFFRTPSLDSRLTLTSDLLQRTLREEKKPAKPALSHLEMWSAIEKAIRARLEFRNALAHQPVETSYERLFDKTKRTKENEKTWHDQARVIVQRHAERQRRPSKLGPISIDEMKEHHAAITKLAERTYHFQHRLAAWCIPLERHPEHRSQASRPVAAQGSGAPKAMPQRRQLPSK